MASLNLDIVTAANVYLDDTSLYGKVEKITGPTITPVMKEVKAVGMMGTKKVWVGFEAIEVDITWKFINENCTDFFKDYNWKIYGNVVRRENGTERNLPAYVELRGRMEDNGIGGDLEGQNWSGQTVKFAVDYIMVKHDNVEILVIDVDNNIYRDHGVDKFAEMRKNANL